MEKNKYIDENFMGIDDRIFNDPIYGKVEEKEDE